ncbi:MAG: DUF4398 domain-containing protein [Polyangiales bacterium]
MRTLVFAVLTLVAAGCGSYPKPEARAASSEGAIRGAQEVGAQQVPQAQLHLKLAQEERNKAMALLRSGEYEKADYMFMRAEADAELANALSREASANAEAQQAKDQLDTVKKQAGGQ